jgi:hypothetical protein
MIYGEKLNGDLTMSGSKGSWVTPNKLLLRYDAGNFFI